MRIEDLDRVREGAEVRQLADLRAIGIGWDGETGSQSERRPIYGPAIARSLDSGEVYECCCSRKEIHEALGSAPSAGSRSGNLPHPDQIRTRDPSRRTPCCRAASRRQRRATVADVVYGDITGAAGDIVLVRR